MMLECRGFAEEKCVPPSRNYYLVLLFLVELVGCGGGAESIVSGTATLDGVALDHGQVVFVPTDSKGQGASGQIEASGDYSVQVGQTGGLPAGEYKVLVVSRAPSIESSIPGAPPAPGKLQTPDHYGQADATDLQFTVEPGDNTIDLNLISK